MRFGNVSGRLVVRAGDGVIDVERASDGRFAPEPATAYDRWDELVGWATEAVPDATGSAQPYDPAELGPPSPRPRQVFALALNYRDHAEENQVAIPEQPSVFTKFPTAVTGPFGDIVLPVGKVDWEIELVVVIGRPTRNVTAADALGHVAGFTIGQDLSERRSQFAGPLPQFALAKSFPGFAPMGPWLVTLDELDDPGDLELSCHLNGERVQHSRTSQLIFPVPELVSHLSGVLPLLPGDLIFTGTPAGVGSLRNPRRFLAPGDELVTAIEGLGQMRHRFAGPS